MMATTMNTNGLRELVRVLGIHKELHVELTGVVQEKMKAMRRADVPGLRRLGEQEHALIVKIEEREGLRRQLMDRLGEGAGLPKPSGRNMTISQLSARLPKSERGALLAAASELRAVAARLIKVNRLAGQAAEKLVGHLHWVFAAACSKRSDSAGYAGDGAVVPETASRLFEAVG